MSEALDGTKAMTSKASYQTRIKARISELKMQIAAAQAELHDLQVAEKVLERLADGGYSASAPQNRVPSEASDRMDAVVYVGKEPTVADKALEALRERGRMTGPDLLSYLQMTWRPELAQTTLSSTLSRMKKDGSTIDYRDGHWYALWSSDELEDLLGERDSTPDDKLGREASGADVFN